MGLIDQKVWIRDIKELGKKNDRKTKPTNEKESQKWLDALINTESIIGPDHTVITIGDREADIYDLFTQPGKENSFFLLRAAYDRKVLNSKYRLWETEAKFSGDRSS